MKRTYEAPVAQKVEFCYNEQVVASGGGSHTCTGSRSDAYVMCRDTVTWND